MRPANGVVANMAYQMGTNGVEKFHNMFNAIRTQNYDQAASAMLNSLWAAQTPNRASELAERVRNAKPLTPISNPSNL